MEHSCHEALLGPHTRTIGIHILLEEIGVPYETEKLGSEI